MNTARPTATSPDTNAEEGQKVHDVIVIGGGVAGLVAAHQLRDTDLLLLEADDRLGGRLLSLDAGPYWLNLGGHLFPGADSVLGGIVEELGLKTITIPGSKFGMAMDDTLYSKSRVELYPFVLPLSVRERVAFARVGLKVLALVARWRRAGAAGPRRAKLEQTSFRSVVGPLPGKVGMLFGAASRRSSVELDEQSAVTAGQLMAGVWAGKKSSLAFNLDGGSSKLADAMAVELGDRALLGASVTQVVTVDDHLEVTYVQGGQSRTVSTRQVVLATPADTAAALASGLPATVRAALDEVTYGSFVSAAFETTETAAWEMEDVYAVTTPGYSFDMLFNHANPLRTGARKPGGSLMVYAGGDRAKKMVGYTDDEIRQTFLPDLLRLFPHLDGRVARVEVKRWPVGLASNSLGSNFAPIREYARSADSIHLCGDYFGDLGNMEIAAESGLQAAGRVRDRLRSR